MNFLEREIVRMEKRIKRIEENPDPAKLLSTKMWYEIERDLRIAQLEAWKNGKPFAMGTARVFPLLAQAMGFQWLDAHQLPDRGVDVSTALELVKAAGFPDYVCERTVTTLGMFLNKSDDLPFPNLILIHNRACLPMAISFNAVARQISKPVFCIDIPLQSGEEGEQALKYIVAQLEECIDFAQSKVPGIRYDEAKLRELEDFDRQHFAYFHEIYLLLKKVPCPMPPRDVFRVLREPSVYPDPAKAVEYARALYEEVSERAEKGIGTVAEERLRIMWAVSGPIFADTFKGLSSKGASIPFFATGWSPRLYSAGYRVYGDETEYGRKLSPLEELARMREVWSGLGRRWIEDVLRIGRDLSIDAIVNFMQYGCTVTTSLKKILADEAERILGIPVLSIEGRQLSQKDFDVQDFEARLEQFVDFCLQRKGILREDSNA